jgi:hypothetical protein
MGQHKRGFVDEEPGTAHYGKTQKTGRSEPA